MPYHIHFVPDAEAHLKALTAAQRSLVWSSIEEQLVHQPTVPTRNRKLMEPNRLATWELRVRDLRVYYDVREEAEEGAVVEVQAVGIKIRDRVRIGDQEYELL